MGLKMSFALRKVIRRLVTLVTRTIKGTGSTCRNAARTSAGQPGSAWDLGSVGLATAMQVQSQSAAVESRWRQHVYTMQRIVVEYFLPLAFLVAVIIALAFPLPGRVVGSWHVLDVRIVQAINNFIVFLISGLTLKTDHLKSALRHWQGTVYGLLAILAITPCFGFAFKALPMKPTEFSLGLALFCVVPTTLGVGVALTAASKGNQALALLLTVATNLLGIFTVPYELRLLLRGSNVVGVEPGPLVVKLILTVLVPAVIGKIVTAVSGQARAFVNRHRLALSITSHVNLAMIIWQTLSGARNVLVAQRFTNILLVIVAAILMHIMFLGFNGVAVKLLGLPKIDLPLVDCVAVLIMSSQKSAPVAVTVISYLTNDIVQQGLLAIPAVVGQLAQIFMGSALAKGFATVVEREQQD